MFGGYGIEIPSEMEPNAEEKAKELGIEIQKEFTEKGRILISSKVHPNNPNRIKLDDFLFSLQNMKSAPQT